MTLEAPIDTPVQQRLQADAAKLDAIAGQAQMEVNAQRARADSAKAELAAAKARVMQLMLGARDEQARVMKLTDLERAMEELWEAEKVLDFAWGVVDECKCCGGSLVDGCHDVTDHGDYDEESRAMDEEDYEKASRAAREAKYVVEKARKAVEEA